MQPIPVVELVESLSVVMDLMSPLIANHQIRVAYIALRLAERIDLDETSRHELLIASLLHDCGALSLAEREEIMQFDFDLDTEKAQRHAEIGYQLLQKFKPFAGSARLVRYHHRHWEEHPRGRKIPLASYVLHLADRVDVLIDQQAEILGQAEGIKQKIEAASGTLFHPGLVAQFLELADREFFWFDIQITSKRSTLKDEFNLATVRVGTSDLIDLAELFSQLIDFRSRFTATHSSGVAACAEKLADLVGLGKQECLMMKIAGYLHDIGKMAIPKEIIDKKAPLTLSETNQIRRHSYCTHCILKQIEGLEAITEWAAAHHERLNGRGYPFHLRERELSLGARIMAVADVFTAVTEDRPYRKGMRTASVIRLLERMAENLVLDGALVRVLIDHLDAVNQARSSAQNQALKVYRRFCTRAALKPAAPS